MCEKLIKSQHFPHFANWQNRSHRRKLWAAARFHGGNDAWCQNQTKETAMTRFFSFLTLGALAIGVTLAAPATSHAQSFGVHVDVGRTHVDVGTGLYGGSYSPAYPRYDCRYPDHHHHHHHRAYYPVVYPRPVVVVPEPVYLPPVYPVRTEVLIPSGYRVVVRP
jgi:hypothetical protein